MTHFVSREEHDFDPMVVETGSSRMQDGRRKHPHIRPQVGSDEELDDESDDDRLSSTRPLNEIFR